MRTRTTSIFLATFLLLVGQSCAQTAAKQSRIVFNIRDFGALGDGKALDSPAIDRAIAAAAETGGGTVLLPAGTYVSGSIHLKSNVHLYLDAGSVILGAPRVILLQNHGMIVVGASVGSVLATTLMAVKAAEIFAGASAMGKIVFMPEKEVRRIHMRSDEHYRQRVLKLS